MFAFNTSSTLGQKVLAHLCLNFACRVTWIIYEHVRYLPHRYLNVLPIPSINQAIKTENSVTIINVTAQNVITVHDVGLRRHDG